MPFYFLEEDLQELDKRISEAADKIGEAGTEMGRSTHESAETWHDNFAFEEASRQQYLHQTRYRELSNIRQQAQVIRSDYSTDKATIGKTVTVMERESGVMETYRIGSYLTFYDQTESVSYHSPIGKLLLGSRVGDKLEGEIAGKQKVYYVLKIE